MVKQEFSAGDPGESFKSGLGEEAFEIPESELEFRFSRSRGPGGQNVNKRDTRTTVLWDFRNTPDLTEEQKDLLVQKLKKQINKAGQLFVSSQAERSQAQNRERAIKNMTDLVNSVLTIPEERKPTKIPRSEKEERLKEKKIISQKKERRRLVRE